MDYDKQIQKIVKLSLEKLSEDSSLVTRGLRDLSIWPKIEELFGRLKLAYENEQFDECIQIAEEILRTDSNHFFTLCYYGRSLYLIGRYEEALKILDQCLKEEQKYYFLWSFRGDVYYKLGRYQDAAENYDEAVKCELYKVWHTANEGNKDTGDGNYDVVQPEQLNTLDNYLYYLAEGEALDEIGYFRQAQFYLSTRAGVYNAYKENDIGVKRAVEALNKVLELNSSNWYAVNQLIEASEFLAEKIIGKNNREALTYVDDALRYASDNMRLVSMKAILLDTLGDNKQAVKLIDIAKGKDPDNPDLNFVYKKIHRE
jgi:tetratricopeptide (TPR) repeat protein